MRRVDHGDRRFRPASPGRLSTLAVATSDAGACGSASSRIAVPAGRGPRTRSSRSVARVELGAHMIELDVQLHAATARSSSSTTGRSTAPPTGAGPVRDRDARRAAAARRRPWFGPDMPASASRHSRGAGGRADARQRRAEGARRGRSRSPCAGRGRAAGAAGPRRLFVVRRRVLVRLRRRRRRGRLPYCGSGRRRRWHCASRRRVGARALHIRKEQRAPPSDRCRTAAGLPVRVWTVNEQAEFARLAAAGVGGVFTDFPERFLQSVPSVSARRGSRPCARAPADIRLDCTAFP